MRGCLDTKQHRTVADLRLCHDVCVHEVGFGSVIDAVRVASPIPNPNDVPRWARAIGELQMFDVDLSLELRVCQTLSMLEGAWEK